MRRHNPELAIEAELIEARLEKETRHYYRYLGIDFDLFEKGGLPRDSLLSQAAKEKLERGMDRVTSRLFRRGRSRHRGDPDPGVLPS